MFWWYLKGKRFDSHRKQAENQDCVSQPIWSMHTVRQVEVTGGPLVYMYKSFCKVFFWPNARTHARARCTQVQTGEREREREGWSLHRCKLLRAPSQLPPRLFWKPRSPQRPILVQPARARHEGPKNKITKKDTPQWGRVERRGRGRCGKQGRPIGRLFRGLPAERTGGMRRKHSGSPVIPHLRR